MPFHIEKVSQIMVLVFKGYEYVVNDKSKLISVQYFNGKYTEGLHYEMGHQTENGGQSLQV